MESFGAELSHKDHLPHKDLLHTHELGVCIRKEPERQLLPRHNPSWARTPYHMAAGADVPRILHAHGDDDGDDDAPPTPPPHTHPPFHYTS